LQTATTTMRYAQKRLISTTSRLSSLSIANIEKFPPKESLFKHPVEGSPPKHFSPSVWASLQPPPPSALVAFAHRLGLQSVLSSTDIIQQVCTHPSFLTLHATYYPQEERPRCNAQLATVGNAVMGLFAAEYLHASYPYLPTRVLKAAVSAQVGTSTCARVAQEMGATSLLRWHRTVSTNHR
jgi:large subunit ribosomal protein L44